MSFLASLLLENTRKLMSARKVKLNALSVGDTLYIAGPGFLKLQSTS